MDGRAAGGCDGLNENVPHWLIYSSSWSSVGDVWEGLVGVPSWSES